METHESLLRTHFQKNKIKCENTKDLVPVTYFLTSEKKGIVPIDPKEYGMLTQKHFVCLIILGVVKGVIPIDEFKACTSPLRGMQSVFGIHPDSFKTPKTLRLPVVTPQPKSLLTEKKWMNLDPSSTPLETSEKLANKLETLDCALSLIKWANVLYPKIYKSRENYLLNPSETTFFEKFFRECNSTRPCACAYCNLINVAFYMTFLPPSVNREGVAQRILGDYVKTIAVCMFVCLKNQPKTVEYALDLIKSHEKYATVFDFDQESKTSEWNGTKVFRGALEYVCRMDISKYMKYVPKCLGDSIYKGWLYLTLFDLFFLVIPVIQREGLTKLARELDTISPEETEESKGLGSKLLPYTSRVSKQAAPMSQIPDIEDLCELAPPCLARIVNNPKEFTAKHIDRKNLASFFVHFKIPTEQIKDFAERNWGKKTNQKKRLEEFYSWVNTYSQHKTIEPIACKTVVSGGGCPFKKDISDLEEGQQVEELCRMKCSRTLATVQERVFYSPAWYTKYQILSKKPKTE